MDRTGPSPYWALFVGPYGLYLLVFLVLPFANVALLSVYHHSPTKIAIPGFTDANYAKLFELYYANLFLRTLRLSVVVTAVCVVLGYPLAYFLARSTSRIMTLGLFLLIMPLMASTVIRVFGWVVILGNEGLVNQAVRLLGGDGVRLLYTEGAVILGLTQQSMPFMVLPIMAAIERIPPSLEEAAENLGASWGQMFARVILPLSMPLGASRLQAFFKVTLPLLRSSLVTGAVFAFIISFSDINLALFLAGPSAPSLPVHIFSQIQFEADPSIAAASALQIVIVGGLILLVQRLFRLRLMV